MIFALCFFFLSEYSLSLCTQGKYKWVNSFLQGFWKNPFRMRWHLRECHSKSCDFWLKKVNQEIPANEYINNQNLAGVLCAPPDFLFVNN